MKTLINEATSALSGVVLFAAGCVMAGLGLITFSLLAVFAMAAVGVAIMAAPFVGLSQPASPEADIA